MTDPALTGDSVVTAGPAVLAIDIGSSAVRTGVIRSTGSLVAAARVLRTDSSAGTTFDPRQLWLDVQSAITALPREARSAVVAVCIAGHVGTVFIDAAGHAVGPGLGWADSSGAGLLVEAAGQELPALLKDAGRISAGGGAGAAYLALRDSHPAAADRVAHVLTPKDLVIFRLTGELATDHTSAAYSGLSAIGSHSWSPRMLAVVGLEPTQLPEQHEATEVVGFISLEVAESLGLPTRVAVVTGATDGSVGASFVLRHDRTLVADIAGTTDVLLRLIDTPSEASPRALVNPYPLGGYSCGGPTGATGAALSHWSRLLGIESVARATDLLAARLPEIGRGAAGLMIDPSLSGSRFPDWRADRKGAVRGQREGHGLEHFLLAAAEGAAHIVRDAVDTLDPTREAGLVLAGGVARSPALVQLRADVLGREIEVCEEPDVTLLGAAMLALLGWGADISQFGPSNPSAPVRPDPHASDEYAALHEVWRRELGFDD